MITETQFKSVRFMSAKNKALVAKQWETFLKYGLKWEHFTDKLYEHLHLHCGFIAHYNRQGFHCEYFNSAVDTERFFKSLFSPYNFNGPEYTDLLSVMQEIYGKYEDQIKRDTNNEIKSKIALLETSVKRAKEDYEFAKKLLSELNL